MFFSFYCKLLHAKGRAGSIQLISYRSRRGRSRRRRWTDTDRPPVSRSVDVNLLLTKPRWTSGPPI